MIFAMNAKADDPETPYEMNAQKASIPAVTTDNIETIIRNQLTAIRDRDANLAYSYMAPSSRNKFDDARDFLSDMRFEFGPIYNHENAEFVSHYEKNKTSVQKVKVKDRYSGEDVTVIYKLVLQNSGNWLIDSFAILAFEEAQPI